MSAGKLNTRVLCQSREAGQDDWGNDLPGAGPFETRFKTYVELTPLRGSETVIAARMTGRQPYVARVYRNSNTRQIRNTWRLVDAHDETRVFEIKSPTHDPDGKRSHLEFLVEEVRQ